MNNNTGALIQELRRKAGYTQKTLAESLHVTDRAVSKWERGYSLPDVALLPKLCLLLDVDLDLLLASSIEMEEWIGLIDIADCDFFQTVYDKPLIDYLLSHFLLLGIDTIHVLTDEKNRSRLLSDHYQRLDIHFSFDEPHCQKAMIINHPWFLFGSDLTQQFRGAMISGRNMKLIPEKQEPVFFFSQNVDEYFLNRNKFIHKAAPRTLGRGMICLDMESQDYVLDVANFVRIYQRGSGLEIANLEEISNKGTAHPLAVDK